MDGGFACREGRFGMSGLCNGQESRWQNGGGLGMGFRLRAGSCRVFLLRFLEEGRFLLRIVWRVLGLLPLGSPHHLLIQASSGNYRRSSAPISPPHLLAPPPIRLHSPQFQIQYLLFHPNLPKNMN